MLDNDGWIGSNEKICNENAQAKGYEDGDGLASGEIAPMFEDTTGATGGGKQYDMPFSMDELENIGMISEVPRGSY